MVSVPRKAMKCPPAVLQLPVFIRLIDVSYHVSSVFFFLVLTCCFSRKPVVQSTYSLTGYTFHKTVGKQSPGKLVQASEGFVATLIDAPGCSSAMTELGLRKTAFRTYFLNTTTQETSEELQKNCQCGVWLFSILC